MSGKSRAKPSGRSSIPTPPVKFADNDLTVTKKKSRSKGQRSFLGWLIGFACRIGIFYVLFAAVWSCPSQPFRFDFGVKDTRPVCRNIAQTYQQCSQVITPYVRSAQNEIEPYYEPVVHAVSPFANRAYKVSRPVLRETTKRSKLLWKKRIDPARKRALKNANKKVQPYIQRTNAYYAQQIRPHVNTAHKTVKPYCDIYQRDVAPYVSQAYQYSLHSSSVTYAFYVDKLHPHVIHLVKQTYSFVINHVDPAIRRTYSLYVRPQIERVLQRVYERKAHYLGSDAIRSAQSDMKHTAQIAEKNAKDAIRKAKQDAIRAQTDPTITDRVKQVKDAVLGGHKDENDPIKIAELDAELEMEEKKVKEQLEGWENSMTDLIEKEYRLAIERLAELRNRRLADLPDRFGLLNDAFVEDQVALILSRIERGIRKLASGTTEANRSDRMVSAQKLVEQQLAKFDDAAQDTKVQISEFYEELLQQERQTIETSNEELRRYTKAAEEAYNTIIADAKFSSTMDEWEGWNNGVKKRALLFVDELSGVQQNKLKVREASGAPDLRTEAPELQKDVQALRQHADSLHDSARKEVVAFGASAIAQLAGEGILAKVSDVTDRISEQATQVSIDAAAGMISAVDSARSRLGLGDSGADSYFAKAKAYVSLPKSLSIDGYVDSFTKSAQAGINTASSAVSQASQSIASAVGASQSAEGYVDTMADSLQNAADSAASMASQASRSVASVVGVTQTPESLGDYAESLTEGAKEAVESAGDSAASVSSYASSALSQASKSAAAALGAESSSAGDYVDSFATKAASAVEDVQSSAASAVSDASSALHTVTRSVASALGASPSPETFFDYVEAVSDSASAVAASGSSYAAAAASAASRSMEEGADSVTSVASSLASEASKSASTAMEGASSSADSAVSSASSIVSKATRSVKSVVGASPTPETLQDYTEDAKDSLSSAIDYVVDAAGSASSAASSGVKQAAEQLHFEL